MSKATRAALALACIHADNLKATLAEALTLSDEKTASTPEVVMTIDKAFRQLHALRKAAAAEHRRRTDAAMPHAAEVLVRGADNE